MSGTLPAWLKGRYIRNGPGDLTVTVRVRAACMCVRLPPALPA